MQIAFLQIKLQKLANWKIHTDKLVCDLPFTTVVGHLELCCCLSLDYARLRLNSVSVLEKLSWSKRIAHGYNTLYACYGQVNANVLSGLGV
ncbi:hypothetical protein CK516_10540 [Nostoc sp. 'Peltigera malacea cyanobiont' DB3992]|nr:hypothetical protein CK516_10540 [Nostoc sp. 'Peltigera malacea cyanobiont' DB3992]